MINEDSGEPVQCPFCSSDGICEHLVIEVDRTFNECVGGACADKYDEFYDLVCKGLSTRLKRPNQKNPDYKGTLKDIWIDALGEYRQRPSKDISIDGGLLSRLLIELCVEAGGVEFEGVLEDESPGASSSLTAIYAKHPGEIFDTALKTLQSRL